MRLENVSHIGSSPVGQLGAGQLCDIRSIDNDPATVRFVDAGNQIQQRGFAGAAGPHQRDEFALLDVQRHCVQRSNRLVAFVIMASDIIDFDQGHC